MSSFFKRVNIDDFDEYTAPNGEDFIRVRKEISKKEMNDLLKSAPASESDRNGIIAFTEKAADLLVVGWSGTDDNGNAIPFDTKVYRELVFPVAQWIEQTLNDHFQKLTASVTEDAEKKP